MIITSLILRAILTATKRKIFLNEYSCQHPILRHPQSTKSNNQLFALVSFVFRYKILKHIHTLKCKNFIKPPTCFGHRMTILREYVSPC